MAMEDILDSVRRTIHRWVNTTTRLSSDATIGDDTLNVVSTRRFQVGDQVMIKNNSIYECDFTISFIDEDAKTIKLSSSILNDWPSENTVLIKTIYNNFVQGIYIGDPEVISHYPAITVNGVNRSSEWLTLESTKERYNIEIGVFVKASTHEDGYRFLLNITDVIQTGLKRNIIPLINDYDIISLYESLSPNDITARLLTSDLETLNSYRRIIFENTEDYQENWIHNIYGSDPGNRIVDVQLLDPVCHSFNSGDTSVIIPKRFIYNSWPAEVDYGKVHKGELLKASSIKWFADEEEMQFFRSEETRLR